VIHCAGLISVDRCEKDPELAIEANVTVIENIARSCPAETNLVYLSTDQIYGETSDYSENNDGLYPINQYGKTKLQGEKKVKELCTDYIIIRTNIFGWNVKPERISSAEWIYHSLKKGEEITLFTDYTFSPVYTEYLGEIIMQLVDIDFTGVINAGASTPCSKYDFGMQLAEEFGFDKSRIYKGSIDDHNFLAPRCNNLGLNVSKLSYIGLTAPDYKASLKKFRQNIPD
jgi:dTDP-4-dehydrorhamnose reductase